MRYYYFITDHIKANVAHLLKCAFDQQIKSSRRIFLIVSSRYRVLANPRTHLQCTFLKRKNCYPNQKPILYALIIIMPHFSPHPAARTLHTTIFMLENLNLIQHIHEFCMFVPLYLSPLVLCVAYLNL